MEQAKDINSIDYWDSDDFEDVVAAALISCFETKVKKNRGAAPADRLTDERIAMIRAAGPYISSNSRLIQAPADPYANWAFDIANDPLPVSGVFACRPEGKLAESNPNSYLFMAHVRRTDALGKYWYKRKAGALYEMVTVNACNDGMRGERRYFTVAENGETVACDQSIVDGSRGNSMGSRSATHGHDPMYLHETGVWAAVALQYLADRRFCWTITAQEKAARAHLGCMQEEVKSLLYARSLPMTATGRKRPILHLVEAHKRRMKSGTDIDVSTFLRGQQVVEIGGTIFKVNPPQSLQERLSEASRKRFFGQS